MCFKRVWKGHSRVAWCTLIGTNPSKGEEKARKVTGKWWCIHQSATEQERRGRAGKGQEESLTTPKILDMKEKGGAGMQSDGAGKGMQAEKPGCSSEGERCCNHQGARWGQPG